MIEDRSGLKVKELVGSGRVENDCGGEATLKNFGWVTECFLLLPRVKIDTVACVINANHSGPEWWVMTCLYFCLPRFPTLIPLSGVDTTCFLSCCD
jgi:hypothetical protein